MILQQRELLMPLLPRPAASTVSASLLGLVGVTVARAQRVTGAPVKWGAVPDVAVKRGTPGRRLFSRRVSVPLLSSDTGVPT